MAAGCRKRPAAARPGAVSRGMKESLAKQLRKVRRLTPFLAAAFYGLWRHRNLPPDPARAESAQWLHESCARGLRAIDVAVSVQGQLPASGLIVSNHLSYLDILAYSAALPCVFVSKAEVADWPIFGRYTRWSGSVFVRRHDRTDAARANVNAGNALKSGVPVVLFPEGTTTDGERVLRFHSTMLQPAIDAGAVITPCAIGYELEDGNVDREVCWWGDMTLLPHVLNLLGKKSVRACIVFGEPLAASGDRKELGKILHARVVELHDELRGNEMSGKFAMSVQK